MDVAADAVVVLAHDQADFAVDFVADQAIDDMDAGLLQLAAPLDVVGLVETRPQFHHGRDLFAVGSPPPSSAPTMRVSPPVR